ncbi:MAG TPA: MBL fold metallo-hydrolase [Alphaproteobacteria bacterium]|nr:MBL fold metallo-hydrolase [Alphaproteobacteria bacterium]
MPLQIADRWFETERLSNGITWLWEPHVIPLMRCNIWHVRGRDRDLLVDTGMGVASLREATRHLIDKPVAAIATHTHGDHVGGHHEFADCRVHALEAAELEQARAPKALTVEAYFGEKGMRKMQQAGYADCVPGPLITALPHAGFDPDRFTMKPAKVTALLEEGQILDTGDRSFEVLHLPGHSPGSIGLWEKATGTLFSGDALYDGPLLDQFEDGDIPAYIRTMKRLRGLPVSVVHGGHEPSFGRARMIELIDAYLASRDG